MHKKLLMLDLDGILNEYYGVFKENEIPPIKFGTENFLKSLIEDYELKIFTSRNKLIVSK